MYFEILLQIQYKKIKFFDIYIHFYLSNWLFLWTNVSILLHSYPDIDFDNKVFYCEMLQ